MENNDINNDINFEETMKQLELIANELEQGDLPLDKSVAKFEEGMKLSKTCVEMLEEAERKISILLQENGKLTEENFEA